MKTVTKTAFANIRLNRSKNILIGIAISLTTLLLFLIPSIGFGMIDIQYEAINRIYPTYHGMYQKVPTETVEKIKAVKEIEKVGLRCEPGMIPNEEYTIYMTSVDKTCAEFMRFEPSEGHFPEKSDEILVSQGLLKAMGLEGKQVGDTITLPYQIQKKGGLDYRKEKTFVICGMSSDSEANEEAKRYTACVSDAFVKEELSEKELTYEVYFRLPADSHTSMDTLKTNIEEIGESLGIPKDYIISNDDYLGAKLCRPYDEYGYCGDYADCCICRYDYFIQHLLYFYDSKSTGIRKTESHWRYETPDSSNCVAGRFSGCLRCSTFWLTSRNLAFAKVIPDSCLFPGV